MLFPFHDGRHHDPGSLLMKLTLSLEIPVSAAQRNPTNGNHSLLDISGHVLTFFDDSRRMDTDFNLECISKN